MPKTNKWLCLYAVAQLGRPYWYGTYGQISTRELYSGTVVPNGYTYNDYQSQLGVKVHDCAGLVVGALMCDDVNGKPTGSMPIAHGATSQYNGNCKNKANSMSNFPYIPGTLVFHSIGSTKTHVGIYVGTYIDKDGKEHNNAVVEAMGHNWGVTTTLISNSKWNAWGQLSCCTIDTYKGMKFDARSLGASTGVGMVTINTEMMRPFVATVLPTYTGKIDYDKVKNARISAMMFFGGELYNRSHIKQTYVNSNLKSLVKSCNDAGMPYALYVNVRSKTVIEADEECRALYYVVSGYPPTLGLWLSLQTNNSKDMNDKILEVYYRYIEKWGLKARCGLYLTPEQLSKITWNVFKDRFYLWQIDPMDVSKVDDELLQPEMFEVPD